MTNTLLLKNDTFELNGLKHRLLHVDKPKSSVYTIRLDQKNPDPFLWELNALSKLCRQKNGIQKIVVPEDATRPANARETDIAVRQTRWSRIKPIVKNPDIWEKSTRVPLLATHAAAIGVTSKTLLADLRTWWIGGQTEDALLGGYYRSGRVDEATPGAAAHTEKSPNGNVTVIFAPASKNARGRKPKCGTYDPFPLTPEMRESVLKVARGHYEEDQCKSVRGAAVAAIDELFALKDKDGTPLRNADEGALLPPLGSYPSVDQVRRLLAKVLTVSGRFKKRNGAASFENNHAASTGSVLDDCLGPGDVYEIDSTVVDAYIVARANRAVILGKATLYLIIDRWSRLIVGFYLSLEPPSWAEGTQAILSIASDWEAVCKRLGVKYDPRVWPAREVMPNRFFGDRGDMISAASNALCDGVQVQVTNAPALNSQAKPIVESGFLTTHVPMRDNVPGYEPPTNPFKRRAKKFHKNACLTLDELAGIYLGIIQTHNRKVKTGYQASPEEILNNQSSKPYEIWERGISDRMGLLSRMPIAMLRRKLSPTDTGVVKKDGIHFRGCIYHSHELREWISRASLSGSFEVVVRYQTNLVDSVTVISPSKDQREYEVSLTTTCEAYAGYSFAEVKFVRDQKARQDISGKHANLAQDVALRQDTLKVAESTSAEMQAVTGNMTPGMRKSDGDVYRAAEARQRRQAVNSSAGSGQQYLQTGAESDVDSASASNECGATPNDSPPRTKDAPPISVRIGPSDSASNAPELDALLQELLN